MNEPSPDFAHLLEGGSSSEDEDQRALTYEDTFDQPDEPTVFD